MEFDDLSNLLGFIIFGSITVIGLINYFVYYLHNNMTPYGRLTQFIVQNYIFLLNGLIVVSVAAGYFISVLTWKKIQQSKEESERLMDILSMFLDREEKEIIKHLVEENGKTTQAEISRLPNMSRVKAHRTLQNMDEKDLVNISSYGNTNKISLTNDVMKKLVT